MAALNGHPRAQLLKFYAALALEAEEWPEANVVYVGAPTMIDFANGNRGYDYKPVGRWIATEDRYFEVRRDENLGKQAFQLATDPDAKVPWNGNSTI